MSSAVELTRTLLQVDTVNPPGAERAAATRVGHRLEAAGFKVGIQPVGTGRANLVARLAGRGRRPALSFTGHLDVVPLGKAEWAHDPFAGELAEDRLYGRGSSDMKSGVAAIVAAAERLAGAWRDPDGGLEIVLTAGEETGCEGAARLAGSALLGDVGAVVVAEPTSNYPHVAHKGVLWLRAQTSGRLAHGSAPELGSNAVYPLAQAVTRLAAFGFDAAEHPLLGGPSLNVGTFHGGENINSIPDRAVADIDIRTVPGVDETSLLHALRELVGGEVELTPIVRLPPMETDPDHPWVRDVFDILEPSLGSRPVARGMRPFTDAAILTPAYGSPPTIVCGPGESAQAHQTDEWCSLRRIDEAVDAYVEIAQRWCGL